MMGQKRIGLVGIGKLGTAMLTHWDKKGITIGIYHPMETKAEQLVPYFQHVYILKESELKELDILILALPAMEVIPFISSLSIQSNSEKSPDIINMATNLPTNEIIAKFPSFNVYGVKYMGHGKDLLEHGNGLFISEAALSKNIEELFQYLGKVRIDSENCLTEVNKLATYFALKTAINLEEEFSKRGLSPEYLNRALTSLAPEVIRSYSNGTLGHFAKEIIKEIQSEED
ncbi:NAD(P)-binding domain-containing protein [Neobacillus sp. YX16]|uniref:NAD(P)-binding domain-containing protein n=1 Tax=Neobacillus sp. YX16 TaxID=3047874 RepID=UPI0024C2A128|nr:NAD(P)-binding domain-containing protein [Neobacillus sp. YX16]WHZ05578.1 NAD(P)-binding domain-containing protein [Neobacillus sp. YX16]